MDPGAPKPKALDVVEPGRLAPLRTHTPFSLFDGDWVNRLFAFAGLHARRISHLIGRCLLLIALTWGADAVASLFSHTAVGATPSESFLKDFSAYLQFIIGLPLFVVAEYVVGAYTREAANCFLVSGVVPEADAPFVERLHRTVEKLRTSFVPDLLCLIIAYALAFATISPKKWSDCPSWHTTPITMHGEAEEIEQAKKTEHRRCDWEMQRRERERAAADSAGGPSKATLEPLPPEPPRVPAKLNAAGRYEMLVALPILNFWWLRWIWKIFLWSWYLWRMSRRHLALVPSHPDATGGVGFISDVQTKFGLVILAYGVSNIASTVGYEVGTEHQPWSLFTVWCPLLIFIVVAPSLFTLPLFMFTKQLYRTKRRALEELYERAGERSRDFESLWHKAKDHENMQPDFFEWKEFQRFYKHVEEMRIVPFDLRSLGELLGQTLGSLLPLLAYLNLPEPLVKLLESGEHIFH